MLRKHLGTTLLIVIGGFLFICFATGLTYYYFKNKDKQAPIEDVNKCNDSVKLYYGANGKDVYLYCMNNALTHINGNEVELKKYLEDNNLTIDNFINTLEVFHYYKKYDAYQYRDNDISVIVCNINDNHDIYIGPRDMEYQDEFCKGVSK